MKNRIVRSWSARATLPNADAYVAFFEGTLAPELRRIDGFSGGLVLCREDESTTLITVLTFWSSMEAVARFAAGAIDRAVVEPEARALLLSFDEHVVHHVEKLVVTP